MINSDNFATIRTFHGMSQRDLASLLHVSQPYLAQVEGGARPLSDNLRHKTMQALGLTPATVSEITAIQAGYEAARARYLK